MSLDNTFLTLLLGPCKQSRKHNATKNPKMRTRLPTFVGCIRQLCDRPVAHSWSVL